LGQQNRWSDEEKIRKAWAKEMKARVDKEVNELRRSPEVVSKKIADAIGRMGVRPDRGVVDKMAAKMIAYRRRMCTQKGNEIFRDRAMSEAVRKQWGIRSQQVSDAQ
jgi:hypothetical protein